MEHERREARVARGRVGLGRRAFTLIELLVVIAVISVLASLLMPVTVRAIAEGQKTQCKSNLNQLGHGISIYGNNFVQELPPFGYWTLGASPGYRSPFWSETMAEFLYPNLPRNERLHKAVRCPLWTGSYTYYSRGYTPNYGHLIRYYCPDVTGKGPLSDTGSLKITEVRRPSFLMMIMDGSHGFCYSPMLWKFDSDWDGDLIEDTCARCKVQYNGGAPFRHGECCMAVFCDGHVRAVRARQWLTDMSLWDVYQ